MVQFIDKKENIPTQKGEICAAGTDLYARRRLGLSSGPVQDISRMADLQELFKTENGATQIGALVKIKRLAEYAYIKTNYPALSKAAGGLATPQIRAMATVGGNLLQKNRCWYFRNPAFNCYKNGGNSCPARSGNHEYGVAFETGPCVAVHPSTLGMALKTYDARVELGDGSIWTMEQLFGDGSNPRIDNQLPEGELVVGIHLPVPTPHEMGGYSRAISRFEAEWAMVECSVRLVIHNQKIATARVGLGAVANFPMTLPKVEEYLLGKKVSEKTFQEAADLARQLANPLPLTEYKLDLIYGTVLDCLTKTVKEKEVDFLEIR